MNVQGLQDKVLSSSHLHLVSGILRYLISHPDAKDSLEGIRHWWLPSAERMPSKEDVEKAVAVIVARGWLEERIVTPMQTVFAVKRTAMKSAVEYLEQFDDRSR